MGTDRIGCSMLFQASLDNNIDFFFALMIFKHSWKHFSKQTSKICFCFKKTTNLKAKQSSCLAEGRKDTSLQAL
jgi:hypothetical protein